MANGDFRGRRVRAGPLPLHFENRIEIFGFVYGMRAGKRIRRKN